MFSSQRLGRWLRHLSAVSNFSSESTDFQRTMLKAESEAERNALIADG